MGSGIYSIGVSALQNAQLALSTTGHNIANATTEGYSRQRIIQVSNVATLTGAGSASAAEAQAPERMQEAASSGAAH